MLAGGGFGVSRFAKSVGDAAGTDVVTVGRLRHGLEGAHQLNFWVVCDNLTIGAASNSVAILEAIRCQHFDTEESHDVG